MTKRDLFILLIRVFGLYWLIKVLLSSFPSNLSFVIHNIDAIGIIWLIIALSVTIGFFYLLIYKSDNISNLLNLNKGFDDERIDFGGLKNIDVIKFAVLLIGGILFLENIPRFLSHTLFAFKSHIPRGFDQAMDRRFLKYDRPEEYVYWGSSALGLLVAYLLISNFRKISEFLARKTG